MREARASRSGRSGARLGRGAAVCEVGLPLQRLLRWPRFALDESGLLPTDSCVSISAPYSETGRRAFAKFADSVARAVGHAVDPREILVYAMAFLNSSASAFLLRVGREPTPKGSWSVNEEYLRLVRIAVPGKPVIESILESAEHCIEATRAGRSPEEHELHLDALVLEALGVAESEAAEAVTNWATAERPERQAARAAVSP
jgi:hypothetical protein